MILLLGLFLLAPPDTLYRTSRPAMGTTLELLVHAPDRAAADALAEAAFAEVERVEQLLSDYRPASELSRINREAASGAVTTDPEMARILQRALGWAAQSGGAFDPTVGALVLAWGFFDGGGRLPNPDSLATARRATGWQLVRIDRDERSIRFGSDGLRLDPGGFGKGYALDAAAIVLRDAGVESALLNFGQSTYLAFGGPPDGWLIHVDGDGPTSVRLREGALSTSGTSVRFFELDGVRYHHLIDPRTGMPTVVSLQTTVTASSAMDADALSTATFVLGPEAGARLLESVPGAAGWLVGGSAAEPVIRAVRWRTLSPVRK